MMDQVPFTVKRMIVQGNLIQFLPLQEGEHETPGQDGYAHAAAHGFDEGVITDGFHERAQLHVMQGEQALGDAAGGAIFLAGKERQVLKRGNFDRFLSG